MLLERHRRHQRGYAVPEPDGYGVPMAAAPLTMQKTGGDQFESVWVRSRASPYAEGLEDCEVPPVTADGAGGPALASEEED